MPPKRSNPSASGEDGPPAKKNSTAKTTTTKTKTTKAATTKATTKKTAAAKPAAKKTATKKAPTKKEPKLKESTAPNWEENPDWSEEKPTGKWAKKCVDRWCLLPPYDTSIEEEQWQTYYRERSALDKVNSWGARESKAIVCEDLGFVTWWALRHAAEKVAGAILGSSLEDEEHKKRIAYTLLGSLYLTSLEGVNDDGSLRSVDAKTRLYSPFGIGTSIDSAYSYHYRMGGYGNQRFASLWVKSKTIDDCDAEKPRACTASERTKSWSERVAPGAVTIFGRGGDKSSGTTAAKVQSFEEPLFGCEGWLSPLKLSNLLHAAATVLCYEESDDETVKSAAKKFQFFQGEDDGESALALELAELATLEKDEPALPEFHSEPEEGVEFCIPQRLLLLARQAEASDD